VGRRRGEEREEGGVLRGENRLGDRKTDTRNKNHLERLKKRLLANRSCLGKKEV